MGYAEAITQLAISARTRQEVRDRLLDHIKDNMTNVPAAGPSMEVRINENDDSVWRGWRDSTGVQWWALVAELWEVDADGNWTECNPAIEIP